MGRLKELLIEIRDRRMDLRIDGLTAEEQDVHRPELIIGPDYDDTEEKGVVYLTVLALWGRCERHIKMTPAEARALATHLRSVANEVEITAGQIVEDA